MADIRYDRFYQYNPYNPEYPTSPYYHGADDGYARREPITRYSDEGRISYADHPASRQYRPNFSADYGETLRGPHAGKGPKGWSRSDERIRDHVCDALEMDAYIDASEIEVAVKDGIVTLTGKVDHRSTKRRVTDRLENLPGVRDVDNNVSVDQSFFQQAKEMLTGEPEARATHRGEGPKSVRH